MRKRFGIISLFVIAYLLLLLAIWNYSYYQGQEEAYIPIKTE